MNGISIFERQRSTAERAPHISRGREALVSWGNRRLLGIVALGSGAALIAYILAGISLLGGIAFAVLAQAGAYFTVWSRASPEARERLSRIALVGLLAGVLATAMYDLTKFTLSHLESSVYNPFEAIQMFGIVLMGTSTSPMTTYLVGTAYHGFNGIMFGVAFAFLFGQRGLTAGIAWGFFLEAFQLALFPGWLTIKAYQEFAQISALSHLAYGAALGLACQHWLGRLSETSSQNRGW